MNIRIDSKLEANTTYYRLQVKDEQVEFVRTRRGMIKRTGYTCSLPDFEQVLRSQTALEVEDFAKAELTAQREIWELLFEAIVPFQQSCWTGNATGHDPGASGFADSWTLTNEVSGLLRLRASIFDFADSNYHHDWCSHEAEAEVSLKVLKSVEATSQANLMELAENFESREWKRLHDSIPSSQGCTWLSEWRS